MLVRFSYLFLSKNAKHLSPKSPFGDSRIYRSLRAAHLCAALLLVFLFFVVSVPSAHAFKITLAWDPNAASEGVAGYKIYYGTESHNYTYVLDVSDNTRKSVARLQKGMIYYFAATAYNADGVESSFSQEVAVNTCTYKISPKKKTFKAAGGTGTLKVNTQPSCEWNANISDVSTEGSQWITIDGDYKASRSGKGDIIYDVTANSGADVRTATIVIKGASADMTFTVTQKATGNEN